MWDIVGKPFEPISKGKDCSGFINERPRGSSFQHSFRPLKNSLTNKVMN